MNISDISGRTLIVIPARLKSKRLPNKPLLIHHGKTLLDYTYEQAKKTIANKVVIATDDQAILDYCTDKKIECVQTSDCPNGTARCFQAYTQLADKGFTRIINWQVDEPLIDPSDVSDLIKSMGFHSPKVLTITAPITTEQMQDENVVKAIVSIYAKTKKCHWFTRSPVKENSMGHCGIYAFTKNTLWDVFNAIESNSSKNEQLEQLSWIEAGLSINSITINKLPLSINAPEDWTRFCNEN